MGKAMRKKAGLSTLCLMLIWILSGCWNYRSLSELAIVAGLAVDMDTMTGEYRLVCETVDMSGDVKTGLKSKLIESTGKTIFDAARNAKMRLQKRLYFGNIQIVVISEELAKDGHIMHLIDWFLRDAELRETSYILVSQEKTAADILSVKGIDSSIVSYEIQSIIIDDQTATSSTHNHMLYEIYDTLNTEEDNLTLSAFHIVYNNTVPSIEVNGTAVFKKENLIGYLTPEESKYLLFILNEVKGGILTLSQLGQAMDDTSLEISENKTKLSFTVQDGKLIVSINTETRVYLAEIAEQFDAMDADKVTSLEAVAGAKLKQGIEDVIKRVQTEYRSDIFGFGSMIHKKDSKLWSSISKYWDDLFPTIQIMVHSKVNIVNSAYIKSTTQEGAK
jgi:spore germination protein KC